MHITPYTENLLNELAQRGLWLQVQDRRLQVLQMRGDADEMTDALRAQVASQRGELLDVLPRLEADGLALTGPVVRVLFARLSASDRQRAFQLLERGVRSSDYAYFSEHYDHLSREDKVLFLWVITDGPHVNSVPREAHVHEPLNMPVRTPTGDSQQNILPTKRYGGI